jgi:hypothetical protein
MRISIEDLGTDDFGVVLEAVVLGVADLRVRMGMRISTEGLGTTGLEDRGRSL